jgi:hypothetical protein
MLSIPRPDSRRRTSLERTAVLKLAKQPIALRLVATPRRPLAAEEITRGSSLLVWSVA